MPSPLFVAAATMPAICVPWPFGSLSPSPEPVMAFVPATTLPARSGCDASTPVSSTATVAAPGCVGPGGGAGAAIALDAPAVGVCLQRGDGRLLAPLRHVDRVHEERRDRAGVSRARRDDLRLLLCLRRAARERDDVRHE